MTKTQIEKMIQDATKIEMELLAREKTGDMIEHAALVLITRRRDALVRLEYAQNKYEQALKTTAEQAERGLRYLEKTGEVPLFPPNCTEEYEAYKQAIDLVRFLEG
jgi:hypothetical protein